MMVLRRLALLLLMLAFAVGSVSVAEARLQAPAVGQIVICSGAGMVTLRVDAEGQPVTGGHLCPDCVIGAGAGVLAGAVPLARPIPPARVPQRGLVVRQPHSAAPAEAAARDPPAIG